MKILYRNKIFNLVTVAVLIMPFSHGVYGDNDKDEKNRDRNPGISKTKKEIDLQNSKQDSFYNDMNEITRKAKNKDTDAIKKIKSFKSKTKKKELSQKVRVSAIKFEGSTRGVGLDELFKTSETHYFAECDAGLVDGKKSSSPLKSGKEFGFLDAQHYVRVPTSEPIYTNEVGNIIGGHTGALFKNPSPSKKGGMTKGQSLAHNKRQQAIEKSSTPGNAALRSLQSHLASTASRENYERMGSFHAYDTKDRDLSKKEDRDAFVKERLQGRDRVKYTHRVLKRSLRANSDASSLSSYETSSYDCSGSRDESRIINDIKEIQSLLCSRDRE